jgi:hypothetical protein
MKRKILSEQRVIDRRPGAAGGFAALRLAAGGLLAAGLAVAPPALAQTVFTVTNTNAGGAGSFVGALDTMNAACPASARVEFNIPAASDPGCSATTGICVVQVPDSVELRCSLVAIDGYTQPGSAPNSSTGRATNARIRVELSNAGTSSSKYFFVRGQPHPFGFGAISDVTIRGIAFPRHQLHLPSGNSGSVLYGMAANHVVAGNWFGWHADGTRASGVASRGIATYGNYITGLRIGGPDPADRNLFTYRDAALCCEYAATAIDAQGVSGALIEGNFVNVAPNGTPVATNGVGNAIYVHGNPSSGSTPYSRNSTIRRNEVHNASYSPITAGAGGGVTITQNVVTGHPSGAAGIATSLVSEGGANTQGAPVVTGVGEYAGEVVVQGTAQSGANEAVRLEFFHNSAPYSSSNGRAEEFLGSLDVATDGAGNATFLASLPAHARNVAVTATRLATGDTSRFSSAGTPATLRRLAVSRDGAGSGTVASTESPPRIACGATCTADVAQGTPVSLVATPDAGSQFAGWTGACSGTSPTCTVTMNASLSVGATFSRQQFTLTVSKSGAGGGTVTSAPAGIACGATCAAAFDAGASVSLGTLADGGSVFAGWSGACSGTGGCSVTMDAAKSVAAAFAPGDTTAPTAVLDGPSSVTLGGTVALSGSRSSDPGGTIASYRWTASQRPAGASAFASPATTASPSFSFTPDAAGTWIVQLVVTDATGNASSPASLSIGVTAADTTAPTAVLDGPSSVTLGGAVALSGIRSSDPGGTIASYRWTASQRPAGAAAFATPVTTASPSFSFTPDAVGNWIVQLAVTDAAGNASSPASLAINVAGADRTKPTAVLTATPATGGLQTTVTLSGSRSFDPGGGRIVSYFWQMYDAPVGSTVLASGVFTSSPAITIVPDYLGRYVAMLVVRDEAGNDSAPATAVIDISDTTAPTAVLDAPETGRAGVALALDGSRSFETGGGAIFTWRWSASQRPAEAEAFAGPVDTDSPTFSFVPDVAGTWVLQLVVVDNSGNASSADTRSVTVMHAGQAPAISSGPPPGGRVGEAYRHAFAATGSPVIRFSLAGGELPPGLALSADGILEGTPSAEGTYTGRVRAANGLSPSGTQSFTIEVLPAGPTGLVIVSGDRQVAGIDPTGRGNDQAFPAPLVVRLTDARGTPVAGEKVDFVPTTLSEIPLSDRGSFRQRFPTARLSAYSVLTDKQGHASVTATASGDEGGFRVRARVDREGVEPVHFELMNAPRQLERPLRFNGRRSPALTGTVDAPFPGRLVVVVLDAGGRRVPGVEVRFFAPESDGKATATARLEGGVAGILAPLSGQKSTAETSTFRKYMSAVTDGAGEAEVAAVANGLEGAYDVIAVLVEEGKENDPALVADPTRKFVFPLENAASGIRIAQTRPSSLRTFPGMPFAPIAVEASRSGREGGMRLANTELWIFAGDDGRGEAGATVVGPRARDGRLASGIRYTAIATDSLGRASIQLVANHYHGAHTLIVAYPGRYDDPKKALSSLALQLENRRQAGSGPGSGIEPDGKTRGGTPAAALQVVSGSFQVASFSFSRQSGEPFAFPLVARAVDGNGRPVKGALVRFVPIPAEAGGGAGSAWLSASSVETDADGLASVTAEAIDGEGSYHVRASVDGATEPAVFVLTNAIGLAAGKARLAGLPTADRKGVVGQGQVQVVRARFPLPLAVQVTGEGDRVSPGREVRFFLEKRVGKEASSPGLIPEGGAPGGLVPARDGVVLEYRSVVTDRHGIAMIRGLANGVPGRHQVVAMLADPGPGDDNDPRALRKDAGSRLFVFDLENTADGVVLSKHDGNRQGQHTFERFGRPLVAVAESTLPPVADPGNGIRPGSRGLEGASLWFIVPVVEESKEASVTLLGGEDWLMGPPGKPPRFRVTEVPVDAGGLAQVTAFANGVAGQHRVIVAYPGDFTDPVDAKFRTDFVLCNGVAPRSGCEDAAPLALTPLTLETVADGPTFTYDGTPPPLLVIARRGGSGAEAGVPVTFRVADASAVEAAESAGWRKEADGSVTRVVETNAAGIADGARGLRVLRGRTAVVQAQSGDFALPVPFSVASYFRPDRLIVTSPVLGSAVPGMPQTLSVATTTAAPIRWTLAPAAGAAFVPPGPSPATHEFVPAPGPGGAQSVVTVVPSTVGTWTVVAQVMGTDLGASFVVEAKPQD